MFAKNPVSFLLMCACLAAPPAWAQSSVSGAIAGVVRDTTGAVLPGVTVEAGSPALIERVRSVVTDAQGNYKIIDLRPGVYTVTFTLAGFATFKREGVELTTGFTATANADMPVSGVEETVVVTGASPVVDVQNARSQTVLSRELLDVLPTGNRTDFRSFMALTVGVTQTAGQVDVGGNQGEAFSSFSVHGTRGENRLTQDGMQMHGIDAAANGTHIRINQMAVQEVTLGTGGTSAESEVGGVQMNVVPKDGGNTLALSGAANYSGSSLQGTNLTDELRARGLSTVGEVRKIYDVGLGVGGPIARDRLWFYTAHRWWGADNNVPGNYFNTTHGQYIGSPNSGVARYTPDLSRPAVSQYWARDNSFRLTWQASKKHKFTLSNNFQRACACYLGVDGSQGGPTSPEGAIHVTANVNLLQATWTYPRTSRLLFEAGTTVFWDTERDERPDEVSRTDIAIIELSNGLRQNAKGNGLSIFATYGEYPTLQRNQRVAVSYVTGSHAFKAGLTFLEARRTHLPDINDPPLQYSLLNGLPVSLMEYASPQQYVIRLLPNIGAYVQDQWTIGRLTLNPGVRFDYLSGYSPAITVPGGPFIPPASYPRRDHTPQWRDISPRFGAAYDLFGNGRTAVKGFIGRYVSNETNSILTQTAPANVIVVSASRTWADGNGNFVPDCNLRDVNANGECGRMSNVAFGQPITNTNISDEYLKGFGHRGYDYQASASLQHEIRPGLGATVAYLRTWWGNFTATDNLLVTPADFNPYCVTAPADPRLAANSGAQLCGLYDVSPARFGQVNSLVTRAKNFGDQSEVFNGLDISMNGRLPKGGMIQGGVSMGQTVTDNCFAVDSPQQMRPGFCHVVNPFKGQTQIKLAGAYPLPWWDLQASGTYQNLSGIPQQANVTFTNAQVAPSLGRNFAAGAGGTVTLPVLVPNTQFEDRLSQLNLRLTKTIRVQGARVMATFDCFNVLNASTVLGITPAYGAAWLRPTQILGARLFKFGGQVDF